MSENNNEEKGFFDKMKDGLGNLKEKAKDSMSETWEETKKTAGEWKEKAGEGLDKAADRAKAAFNDAKEKAKDFMDGDKKEEAND